jgi:predicted transposase/invertase (TIGR01784 family)
MKLKTFKEATGIIEYTLTADLVFHYVMQQSQRALINLVCALKGIPLEMVVSIEVMNPIDLNGNVKETVMDLKLVLNNNEIINIELQMYTDEYWISRSILYLCRAYDSIKEGDNYSLLKPTTHICITDKDLIPNNDQFYSKYLLMNTITHELYSTDLGINVLQLNHIDNATQDDIDNNLVYWAKLFRATTWEEFIALADGNEIIEEVGDLIFTLNTDDQSKELLEGRRRYREQLATSYAAGEINATKKLNSVIEEKDAIIADKDATIADNKATIADKNATIADKDATIADKDATIAELQARIKELEKSKDDSKD